MLRGLRPLSGSSEVNQDSYRLRTLGDYFCTPERQGLVGQENSRHLIFSGLELFADVRKRLLGRTKQQRETVRGYEEFLSKHFFSDQDISIIPVEEDGNDVVHIRIGNQDERPIYDLGDGMQSLIICTYPIFMEQEPGSIFFLEEPDLCMHPSLQRSFLDVLIELHMANGHQFFLTTHSNHMLDIIENDNLFSVYTFSEFLAPESPIETSSRDGKALAATPVVSQGIAAAQPRYRIRPSRKQDREILRELGVRASATFLANATIWVDGISECAYFRAYMKAFVFYLGLAGKRVGHPECIRVSSHLAQYKEDRHYAFMEYNGSNRGHFSYGEPDAEEDGHQGQRKLPVQKMCAKPLVISDGDMKVSETDASQSPDRSDYIYRLQADNDWLIVLPGKEVENLIPPLILKSQVERDISKYRVSSSGSEGLDVSASDFCYLNYGRSSKGLQKFLVESCNLAVVYGQSNTGPRGTKTWTSQGTLPKYRKAAWRDERHGVPALIRESIESIRLAGDSDDQQLAGESAGGIKRLRPIPEFLTQDLVWLCLRIYLHIASETKDELCRKFLDSFNTWIEDSYPLPDAPPSRHEEDAPPPSRWPSFDLTEKSCLLTRFLEESSQPAEPIKGESVSPGAAPPGISSRH